MKFRKKPVEIEAYQYDGTHDGLNKIRREFWNMLVYTEINVFTDTVKAFEIVTKDGNFIVSEGDWIIKEPFPSGDRDYYPCKPDIFKLTYEPIEEGK
jgi:hypothetical protein